MANDQSFQVLGFDHVHIHVRDRRAAQAWYARVLGCVKTMDYAEMGDSRGPIVLSLGDRGDHLALFERKQTDAPPRDRKTVALRVSGEALLAFLGRLPDLGLAAEGAPVTASDLIDHGNTWSLYFSDPDGNSYELTTYDYAAVAAARR